MSKPPRRRPARLLPFALAALLAPLAAVAFSACDQDEGERCEVDSDCKSGFRCLPASKTCGSPGGGSTPDAAADTGPAVDAPPAEARPEAPEAPRESGAESAPEAPTDSPPDTIPDASADAPAGG